MDIVPYWLLATVGTVLLVPGVVLWIAGIAAAMRAFSADKLCTGGAFGICRHPIYATWVVFLVPGLVLLMNTWLGLAMPPVMYVILRMLVRREEQYLGQKFGEDYLVYKKRVPAVLPLGWLTGR